MTLPMMILAIAFCVAFLYAVLRLVARGRLLLRYSLLWFFLGIVMLLCVLFPNAVFALSSLVGFVTPANFMLLVGLLMVLAIALSMSVALSRQNTMIKNLTQKVALLEKDIEDGRK